jgi:hypothetical protein
MNNISMVMSIPMSDSGEPKNLDEVLNGPQGAEWEESIKSDINNFISRDAWTKVSLRDIIAESRKPICTKTMFKIKDGEFQYVGIGQTKCMTLKQHFSTQNQDISTIFLCQKE